ncbi:MAG: translocation/assembly module TamB domain-containing protein [Vicinamibacterales bacterium]
MKTLLQHPVTQRTRTIVRRIVTVCSVILAVVFVTTLTVDLGPALKARAEAAGSAFIQRPMHIGRLGVRLWSGRFIVEDFVIEGLTPQSRPFLNAKRIDVSMPWSTLVNRRVVFDAIEMTDWRMYVEMMPDGRHNFPKFTRATPRGPTTWTSTTEYIHAYRGEFTYEDHGTPWSTVARNLDVTVARPTSEYRGTASFSNGTVQIQQYEPMRADLSTSFRIVGGQIVLDRIDLDTDGATTALTGVVDAARWPEQTYQIRSRIQYPRMREIFFARDTFSLAGEGEFTGTFHLFKEVVNGKSRTGRELKGAFSSESFGVNAYRFPNLRGNVRWVPERVEVTDAGAALFGGTAEFTYVMAPLGVSGVLPTYTFDVRYAGVDMEAYTNFLELRGLRLAGSASGNNLLAWESGHWPAHRGSGAIHVDPPAGTAVMSRRLPVELIEAEVGLRIGREPEPFSNHTPREPVPLSGDLAYAYGPEWIDLGSSQVATPSTFVAFEGRTAYGERSRIPFHVSSRDWQESDRLLAGIMTAFGSPTNAIPIGGYGTFDGTMLETLSRPRIEGRFAGERMRAFDVMWGSGTGTAVIENSYADVTDVRIGSGDSTIMADGRFSVGYPRRDGGEEINAIIRVIKRPVADLRHAFTLDDYDVDGLLSGEFHVYGNYETPYGFGNMAIVDGVAYGEPFETATASLRLEGEGVRLDNIAMSKGGGRGVGAAYLNWTAGTYSFNFDAQRISVEHLALVSGASAPPLVGLLDFVAAGSGTFEVPRYDVRATIRDFFVGDEGIGRVVGTLNINGEMMTLKVEAASPRLTVSGSGQVELTPEMRAEMSFNVSDTSLDPYIRAFQPDLSPFTTAIASGSIRVVGSLSNIDELLVDASVDRLRVQFFDYQITNQAPIRVALDRHAIRLTEMRLVGEGTGLDLTGVVNLHDERIAVRAAGFADLGILQGFVPNIRSSGRASVAATLEGGMRNPLVSGTLTLDNGRIRQFDLPHALENIAGVVRFDSRGIRLDEVTGRLGGGPVQFGGRIEIDGYRPGRLDVTMSGQNMRLRFPEGMTSLVDADLTLQGTVDGATLGGNVAVRNAVYRRAFDTGGGVLELAGSATSQTAPLETTVPLRYDVRILVPSTLRIENKTVRLEANADLQLRGTFDRPVLVGRAEIERGDFTFEGRRYQVTRGSIDFNNPTRIAPFFDIETETRVRVPKQTYRVIVRAVGTFERFTPEFSSDPPLPEVEVLGLLFSDVVPGQDVEFRRYNTAITPEQQLLRERATRAILGSATSGVGRVVEQTFGVDTFQLTPSLVDPTAQSSRLDPAARLTIGKRLSDRIYLTYSRSLSSSTRDQIILLEYDQTDRFSWILSRNEDRTYALDVRVRHVF